MMRIAVGVLASFLLCAGVAWAAPEDPDSDGDGLSDFHEKHKYGTNPKSADSDGDGKPDGDRDERREYAYTIRSVTRTMRPVSPETLNDDYQDVRVLDETNEYVEMEVVHYPFGTAGDGIVGNPRWREEVGHLAEYVRPGVTANWDAAMRDALVAALAKDGIDVRALDDAELVRRVAPWLLRRCGPCGGFTTFFVHFPDGKPTLFPGLERAARQNGMTRGAEEQWSREVLARGMFENRTCGTCTSTAIYLSGCLRALGIPTRLVLCQPIVDASDPAEMEMVERDVENPVVRRTILAALRGNTGWTSHTFNEVFVNGRWRRLNYDRLGAGIFGTSDFGVMTHVLTVNDWAHARAAETIGRRQGLELRDDAFGHANTYSTIDLSDRTGAHAPPVPAPAMVPITLTVERALWRGSADLPADVASVEVADPHGEGHLLLGVREREPSDTAQYGEFFEWVGREFRLRADGHEDVAAWAERGYWGSGWFYVRVPPVEWRRMASDVAYALVAVDDDVSMHRWAIAPGVTVTKPTSR
jgi:hypothetical protein